jgi:hypothetical protein
MKAKGISTVEFSEELKTIPFKLFAEYYLRRSQHTSHKRRLTKRINRYSND